jgi:hypothetical protein
MTVSVTSAVVAATQQRADDRTKQIPERHKAIRQSDPVRRHGTGHELRKAREGHRLADPEHQSQ